ncbi:MAG TPA: hypothetical protein VLA93_07050 [Pyrinomonadaceae bacterium]|nr:hypothetical protein [Pyrinomonadaceae bacterium]
METKKSKYDTNPLDPDVERKTQESWGFGGEGAPTQEVKGATQRVGPQAEQTARENIYSEAPTRRYDSSQGAQSDTGYPSVFIPPTYAPPTPVHPSQIYQPPPAAKPTSRTVAGIGMPEKWAMMLPYAPFYIGLVFSLVELFLVPRREAHVRFHASQALALHIAILIIHTVFGVIGTITDSSLGGTMFKLAAFIFLVISMSRVWQGESHRIAPLNEPAQWFNDHIEPRNR